MTKLIEYEKDYLTDMRLDGGVYLEIEKEGTALAPWFNYIGVTLAVLKYRMPNGHFETSLSDVQEAIKIFHQCCIFILQVVTDGAKVRGFITHANGKPSWKDGSLKNKRMLSPLAKLTKVRAFNLISEESTI